MEVADLWHRVLHDPRLQDLPYRIETNELGQLVLSPHKPRHSLQQGRLVTLLNDHLVQEGQGAVEFAVETPKGIKVPDVVWISATRLEQIPSDAEASPVMPELVVEVLSPGNTPAEMQAKRQLYFDGGAREVWLCDETGRLHFYDADGQLPSSRLAPSFPTAI